jgi:hypothetical protein
MHTLADSTLGISAQAYAVLALLSRMEPADVAEYDEDHNDYKDYKVEISTHAWYNGRERGVCLEVRPSIASKKALLITFGEHRNSDDIFIDSWVVETHFLNPPTVADFTDEAYEQRTLVKYGHVAEAVDVIRAKMKEFLEDRAALDVVVHGRPARVLPELGDKPAGADEESKRRAARASAASSRRRTRPSATFSDRRRTWRSAARATAR